MAKERSGDGAAAVGAGKKPAKQAKAKGGRAAKRGGRARASKPKG